MIASAMSAAPKAVAGKARPLSVWRRTGTMKTLGEGMNGFTCMPGNPASPGPDPMCLDANAMEWAHAWVKHEAPPDKVGFRLHARRGVPTEATPITTPRRQSRTIIGSRLRRTSWSWVRR